MSNQSLEQLAALPYPVKLYFEEEDGLFVAEFLDLPGCHAYGETVEEAYKNAQEAKKEWLKVSLEQGFPIPEPSKPEEHSGRILVRMPNTLHTMLVDKAKMSGTSLNQYIVHLLSGAVVGDHIIRHVSDLRNEINQLRVRIATTTAPLMQNQSLATAEEYASRSLFYFLYKELTRSPQNVIQNVLGRTVKTSPVTDDVYEFNESDPQRNKLGSWAAVK